MRKHIILLGLLNLIIAGVWASHVAHDRIRSLPGYGPVDTPQWAGMLPISERVSKSAPGLFYWFVGSRYKQPDIPLVLWLNGGPGASSLYGFLMETGPYEVDSTLSLKRRRYAWSDKADYLVIDQPAGTGFSLGTPAPYQNEAEAMDQLAFAVKAFFMRHPSLASKPVYIAGQSYAGKYIPQLAVRLLNARLNGKPILLKGILIGDGWVNPKVQQSMDAEYVYTHGLIDQSTRLKVNELYKVCAAAIDRTTPSSREANRRCGAMQRLIKRVSGCSHLVNIATCAEPDTHWMEAYLNQSAVRQALHVDPRVKTYHSFDVQAEDRLMVGEQDSIAEWYSTLLRNHVAVMIYNGLDDGTDSNVMGTDQWLAQLSWAKDHGFNEAKTCPWYVHGVLAGSAKTRGGLTQVKIRQAGHLAPIDQPRYVLDLFDRFIHSRSFCDRR